MLFDFGLNLLCSVGQKDRRVWVTGGHFLVMTLKSWEELRVHSTGLRKVQPWSQVSGHSKVRILVDTTRNQTKKIIPISQHILEGTWDTWSSLDCSIGNLAAVLRSIETEDSFDLIVSDGILKQNNIVVKVTDVI